MPTGLEQQDLHARRQRQSWPRCNISEQHVLFSLDDHGRLKTAGFRSAKWASCQFPEEGPLVRPREPDSGRRNQPHKRAFMSTIIALRTILRIAVDARTRSVVPPKRVLGGPSGRRRPGRGRPLISSALQVNQPVVPGGHPKPVGRFGPRRLHADPRGSRLERVWRQRRRSCGKPVHVSRAVHTVCTFSSDTSFT